MKISRAIAIFVGVSILVVSVCVIGYVFAAPDSVRLVLVQQAAPYLLIPAYLALVLFIFSRAKTLAGISLIVIIVHLTMVIPEIAPSQPGLNELEKSQKSFKVFSQNVMFDNATPEAPANAIRNANPDLILLQEIRLQNWDALESTGVFKDYPFVFLSPSGADGLAMASKTPLTDTELLTSPGFPTQRARTVVDGHDLVIYNVHTRAPVNGDPKFWRDDLSTLKDRLTKESGAVLASGDFNASAQHPPFRQIIKAGFDDAATATNNGLSRTWPFDRPGSAAIGGWFRLDHTLLNKYLRARSYETLPANGSDHAALVTQLVFSDTSTITKP